MTDPMSTEELRACRERAERMPAMPAGDALRFSERCIPRLLATIAARDERFAAVGRVLAEEGCDCDRDHHRDECDDECDHDACLGCRIEAAMKGASQ